MFQKLCCLVSSCSIVEDKHLDPECCSFPPSVLYLLTDISTYSVTDSLSQGKRKVSIVYLTTGNVEVRCSVEHSDIYGSRCAFKCKLIFAVGDMKHHDTYLQNPKG